MPVLSKFILSEMEVFEWEETRFTFSTLNFKFPSTTVERSLQIRLFMQNEPNLPKAQMNVNKVLIKDYENKPNWTLGENEPKTNPIKANSNPKTSVFMVTFRRQICKIRAVWNLCCKSMTY